MSANAIAYESNDWTARNQLHYFVYRIIYSTYVESAKTLGYTKTLFYAELSKFVAQKSARGVGSNTTDAKLPKTSYPERHGVLPSANSFAGTIYC